MILEKKEDKEVKWILRRFLSSEKSLILRKNRRQLIIPAVNPKIAITILVIGLEKIKSKYSSILKY